MYAGIPSPTRRPEGSGPWLLSAPTSAASQALTLVCVPHAGSGPGAYRPFGGLLAPHIALRPVHLPGRESRIGEEALESVPSVVRALLPHLIPELRGRFAIWGHSMGGFVAFEVARVLEARFGLRPDAVVVSGCQAPRSPARQTLPERRTMDDDKLWASASELNGIPDAVSESAELRRLLLPTLRADFAVFETYDYAPGRVLSCPVYAFAGRDDPEAAVQDMQGWARETRGEFVIEEMPGGHFFHLDAAEQFSRKLADALLGERVGRP